MCHLKSDVPLESDVPLGANNMFKRILRVPQARSGLVYCLLNVYTLSEKNVKRDDYCLVILERLKKINHPN